MSFIPSMKLAKLMSQSKIAKRNFLHTYKTRSLFVTTGFVTIDYVWQTPGSKDVYVCYKVLAASLKWLIWMFCPSIPLKSL